jgi:hypothetical protein
MKKTFFVILVFCVLMGTAHAVEINLSSDKKGTALSADIMRVTIKTGETIIFHVKVTDGASSAGYFSLSREVEPNRYTVIGSPHFVVSSCGCKGVTGTGEIDEILSYVPTEPGKYRADATYGGRGKRIEFLVEGEPVSTTGPTTTTVERATSTTASVTSTTTTTTTTRQTTTTTTEETATTYPALTQDPLKETTTTTTEPELINTGGCGCNNNYLVLLAIPLAMLFVYIGHRAKLLKK